MGRLSSPSQIITTCNQRLQLQPVPLPTPRGSGASLHVRQLPYLPPGNLGPAGIFPAPVTFLRRPRFP